MHGRDAKRRPRRVRRVVLWSSIAVLVVLLGLAGWLGWRALTVRDELTKAQGAVAALRSGGDVGDNLHTLASSGAAAARLTDDPVWRLAELLPVAGDNLRAVRLSASSLDELSNGLALPLLGAVKGSGSLAAVIPPLQAAGPKLDALTADLAAVGQDNLVPQVRDGLAEVSTVMKLASPVVRYLPGLLGADGPRNYLVVAQNNAELLALGGSSAFSILVHVDHGELSIVRQAPSQDFNPATPLPDELPRSLLLLYGPVMKTNINATVSRPDWPTAAQLITKLWNRDIEAGKIDGVASIDPIALSYILRATGPVQMKDGETLTSDNFVRISLKDAYAKYGDVAGDNGNHYFSELASTVFQRVAAGDFDAKAMLQAIQDGTKNRSLMFYSYDEQVQKFVATTKLGGVLPRTNRATTSVGVFFRDHSLGSKIDYYLKPSSSVVTECRADGTTAYTVTVGLKLDISKQAEAKLPEYVNTNLPGHRYDTEVFIYGPPKSYIESYQTGERAVFDRRVKDLGRRVLKFTISTTPGQSGSVSVTYTIPPQAGYLGPTQVLATPTVHPVQVSLTGAACPLR